MIAQTFQDAFTPAWVQTHLTNPTHDLLILRDIIPWQSIMARLVPTYHSHKGRIGHSLRLLVAVCIMARLRHLSDRQVIAHIQENRYLQYFCNVPDAGLRTFLHPSTLCRFRKRLGKAGCAIIEEQVFQLLKGAAAIEADTMLMDSTVLASPIIYPTDVRLLYKAFTKMAVLTTAAHIELWWDPVQVKQRWRAYNLDRKTPRLAYLQEFSTLLAPALQRFAHPLGALAAGPLKTRWRHLLEVLRLLEEQTQQKLAGQRHIANRLVSLDDLDARPIKKGKSHPSTEFGTTLQLTFNRQGFMITTENFIGQPNDATRYRPTLEQFRERMQGYPSIAVTDLGYRSATNLQLTKPALEHVFMGRSADVGETHQETCRQARSATEGFIAVAKHLRGFGRSLYRGLTGATIWTRLSQCAYNLHKLRQLYRKEELAEATLIKLGL